MITKSTLNNAHKFAFLVGEYPQKSLQEIVDLFKMRAIDINVMIWAAQDEGFVDKPDGETGKVSLLNPPAAWDFGKEVEDLEANILYGFSWLAKNQTDLEENEVGEWLAGYTPWDIMVAIKHLIREKKLVEYAIEDTKSEIDKGTPSTYIFYTLFENKGEQWGRNHFKEDPLEDSEVPSAA